MNSEPKILVVDDEPGIREGCRRALRPHGYHVDTAENGEQGLQKVMLDGFDLVLIDVMMPGLSGIELISRIYQIDPEIICIIITGYATVELAVAA
ncbi:MAG TPA: response regulator, partial [Anaerolineales bacterium]|nr:response regulator [Anaerolineales bacterium]